jgi:hypothetical protein
MNVPQPKSAFCGALTRDHWDVPIRVRLLPYVEFSRRLDGELDKLVARWADQAAPNARQPRRR